MFKIPEYNKCGIYALINNTNGKMYIGSTLNVRQRIKDHFRVLKNGKHHVKELQNDYNMGDCFRIVILEKCNYSAYQSRELRIREKYYIEKYDSFNKGYNQMIPPTGTFELYTGGLKKYSFKYNDKPRTKEFIIKFHGNIRIEDIADAVNKMCHNLGFQPNDIIKYIGS